MTNVLSEKRNPSTIERIALVKTKKTVKEKAPKYDYDAIVRVWTPQTNIVDRILKADPAKPFYVNITPDMAMDILKLNDTGQNREIINQRIESYVGQMEKKKWMPRNGDTIRISVSGKLIDGQHRLWSIYLSGQPCEYLIVTGLADIAFSHIDIGGNRNAGDITHINGYGTHAGQLSQVVKLILLFKSKSIVKGSISERDVANSDVNEFEQNKGTMSRLIKDLEMVKAKDSWMDLTNNKYFTVAQWVFIFYLLRTQPRMEEEAFRFLSRFADGVNLKATNPIKVLKNYFDNDFKHLSKGNGKMNRSNKATLTTKVKHVIEAWNLNVRKETSSKIDVDLTTLIIGKPIYSAA